ncbi:hypothetical protein JXA40_06560 [bacterium]|nr:hypothetical protein [candidate division CSSED10-310 bacterium]
MFIYTLVVMGIFLTVMIWLTPPSVGNKQFGEISSNQDDRTVSTTVDSLPDK